MHHSAFDSEPDGVARLVAARAAQAARPTCPAPGPEPASRFVRTVFSCIILSYRCLEDVEPGFERAVGEQAAAQVPEPGEARIGEPPDRPPGFTPTEGDDVALALSSS